jgi:uncharacterized protein YlxW (UPF0749 family)
MAQPPHRRTWRRRLSDAVGSRSDRRRAPAWRLLTPAVFLLAGGLFVTSAVSSGGMDLRAGRYDDLGGLANAEQHELEQLRARAADLTTQVDTLTADLGRGSAARLQARVDRLKGPAGLDPVHGPGLTITLDDAPQEIQQAASPDDVSALLVHQQDIQAVANALWAGGAEAMTIQGQRVVATTGIKCVGNTVVLHDVPYSLPYVLSAIGNPEMMLSQVDSSPHIETYLQYVEAKHLGWNVQVQRDLQMPGYDGSTDLSYARPAGRSAGGGGAGGNAE